MTVVSELTSQVGVAEACQALAVTRSSIYRSRQVPSPKVAPESPPARSPRALSEEPPIAKLEWTFRYFGI
jgi:hypothetical protein